MRQIKLNTRRTLLLAGVSLAGLITTAANAQAAQKPKEETTEVVITAERRNSSVQKTAASVSVRTGDELRKTGRSSLTQILEDIPGVDTLPSTSSDNPGRGIAIRGVLPDTAPGGSIAAPTSAVYVDGVFAGLGSDYDVMRAEVLRGPQGTLYGRSATGGVVAISTYEPDLHRINGDLLGEVGSYNLHRLSGALNVPVIDDKLAFRFSGSTQERDGTLSAVGGYSSSRSARAKMLYHPNETVSLLLGVAATESTSSSGGISQSLLTPTTYSQTVTRIGTTNYHNSQVWAKLDWDLGFATVTYIPAYRTFGRDGATVSAVLTTDNNIPTDEFMTHELRLASNSSGKLSWQAGLFSYDNDFYQDQITHWNGSGALVFSQVIRKQTTNFGLFAEGTYAFSERTRLTIGLRGDDTRVITTGNYTANVSTNLTGGTTSATYMTPEVLSSLDLTADAGTRKFRNTTYKVRLEHNLTPRNMLYLSTATGFQPGDVQFTTGASGPSSLPYDQQQLTAYELGSKNRFFGGKLTLNGAIFYNDYTGYQQQTNVSLTSSPVYVVLTSPARMKGFEVEGQWRFAEHDRLNFGYSYIDAKFTDSPDDFKAKVYQTTIPKIEPKSGNLAYIHDMTVFRGDLSARVDARYASKHDIFAVTTSQYANGSLPFAGVPDTTIYNASLSWTSPRGGYSVTLYGRNLSDEIYNTSVTINASNPVGSTVATSEPRTYGIVLQAHY